MRAIIHQDGEDPELAMVSVAGVPLIGRQLEWLKAAGCEHVAVEIRLDAASTQLSAWLDSHALGLGVTQVLTGGGAPLEEIIRRLGWPPDARVIGLPANVLGTADLSLLYLFRPTDDLTATLAPPEALPSACVGRIRLFSQSASPAIAEVTDGWGLCIRSPKDALSLGDAVMMGTLPSASGHRLHVPAHAVRPGVFVARGAVVDPSASLVAPVFVGGDASVRAGARVGPSAVVGARAVVERRATVSGSIVDDGVIVGEGVSIANSVVRARELIDLDTGDRASIVDPLLLSGRVELHAGRWPSRGLLAALLLLVTVASLPFLVASLARAALTDRRNLRLERSGPSSLLALLLSGALGRRSLVGVATKPLPSPVVATTLQVLAERAPLGVIDIGPALAPGAADPETRARALAWYAHSKSLAIDARLVWRTLLARSAVAPRSLTRV